MNRKISEFLKLPEDVNIPVISGIQYRFWNKLDNKSILREQIPHSPLNETKRDVFVTVSLTSYPARIKCVYLAIKSLMLQSFPADRVILWLADSQFENRQLPAELTALEKYGLEIKWCDDLYGHKKYYYCLQNQQPDEVVITYDDDIIYPPDSIKRLIEKHRQYPNCIVCERAQSIRYDENGMLMNPGRWSVISDIGSKSPSFSLNPSPGGGCLIPYGGFYKDAQDKQAIKTLAYKNDDLWYMFMAAENETKTVKTQKWHKTFSVIEGSQTEQMAFENIAGNRNQVIMEMLKRAYPNAYQRIVLEKDN